MKKFACIAACVALCASLCGCGRRDNQPPLNDAQNQVKARLETQMRAAAETARTYHAMSNTVLLDHLLEESKAQREPFNSLAYRELKTRPDVDANALVAQVKDNPGAAGLLPLLLLRKLDGKTYLGLAEELRAKVLTDALGNSRYFNNWGIPGYYLEDASSAMIEAGRSTAPALRKLLSDTRSAPLFGSQEAMLSERLRYRVSDYALFFLMRIDGKEDFHLPSATTERDALIKAAS